MGTVFEMVLGFVGRRLLVAVSSLIAVTSAQAFAAPDACEQIRAACRSAGFVQGGGPAGDGIELDCYLPILHGTQQPARATTPLPPVDEHWVDACRARRDTQSIPTDAQQAAPNLPSMSRTAVGAPSGLVAVIVNKPGHPFDLGTFNNPYISGVALQIHWSDIEPVEGKPDWSTLDNLVADAAASKKWVQFLIFPGFFTPSWALAGVQSDRFALQYGPGKGTVETLPMPWDKLYLDRWLAFVKLLSERYGKSPALRLVAADGPTSVSAEASLPNSPADLRQWQADGYTPDKYVAAWNYVFQAYAADFPDQYVSMSLGGGLGIDEHGIVVAGQVARNRQRLVDQAVESLGSRFAIQFSNLDGTQKAQDGLSFVIGYNGRVVTGLQMRTSAAGKGMGANGDQPSAVLTSAIDKGMRANASGQRASYLEIYEPDVLAPGMQSALRDGASLFERQPSH